MNTVLPDAGMAILLGERAHLIEFPLPPGATTGSIVPLDVCRPSLLNSKHPRLEVRNVTQTSVTLLIELHFAYVEISMYDRRRTENGNNCLGNMKPQQWRPEVEWPTLSRAWLGRWLMLLVPRCIWNSPGLPWGPPGGILNDGSKPSQDMIEK
ncbi:hypothetical protein F5I97DRAFT_675807 [Phlebopus sp. FC_14]|nr:hypothetical protein F5I97DRAFT_675807 [Phlebopus sp. FC_14]